MNCPHHSPKEENNRLSTFVADPANDSDKENVDDNKTNNTKPSTDNTIVVKKDSDAATFTSKQTNTTASSSKDNSKTEVASSDDESSLASIDSDILRREVTTCNITRHTFRKELTLKIDDLKQTLESVQTTTLETNANVKEMKGTLETGLKEIVQLVSKNNATAEENVTLKNMQKEYMKKIAELEAALEKEKTASSFNLPSSSSTRSRRTRADSKSSEVASEKAKKETSLAKVQKKKVAAEKKRKEKNHKRGTVML